MAWSRSFWVFSLFLGINMSNLGCFCFGSVTLADDDEGPFFLLLSSLHSWASSFEWDSRCFRRPLVVPLGALYDLPQLLHCALFLSDSKSYRCPKGTTNPSEASSVSCLFQKKWKYSETSWQSYCSIFV